MDRSKLSPNESDKVARRRNQMHEIALQKQINVIQREGRLLERELREIKKVKQTLMQLRDPLRRRVLQSEHEEFAEEEEAEKMKKKASVLYGLPRQAKSRQERTNKQTSGNKKEPFMIMGNSRNKNRTPTKTEQQSTNCRSKLFYRRETQQSNDNLTLPVISNSNPCIDRSSSDGISTPNTSTTETVPQRRSLTARQPSSKSPGHTFNDQDDNNTVSETEDSKRPETSMTVPLRKNSLTFPKPPASSLGHRPRCDDFKNENSLTMEETLRIKGKFRQIGHSIIATALLKGLRQRGAVTSEAIHNMHKPISVETTDTSEATEEKEKSGLEKFRRLTRKAINVNAVINLKNSSSPPQTDVKSSSTSDNSKFPHRKLGLAGVAQAVKLTQANEKGESRKQVMNEQAQNRRRKIGIGNIVQAAMISKALKNCSPNGNEVSPTKVNTNCASTEERTVRFKVEVWD